MITENAQAIVNFLDFLRSGLARNPFEVEIIDDEDFGTLLKVRSNECAYRHELNALMAVIDNMTPLVTIQKVNEDGKLSWNLW